MIRTDLHPDFVQTSAPDGWLCVKTPDEPVVFATTEFGISPIRAAYNAWRLRHDLGISMSEPDKIKITVCAGTATEAIGADGRRTYAIPPGGIKVMGWDAGNRYYNFNWDGTTWQIRDDKVRLGWEPLPWPWWRKQDG